MTRYLPTWPVPVDEKPPKKAWAGWKPIVIVLLLSACSGISASDRAFLREKSAEIGAKDVVLFETRRRATEAIIGMCLKDTPTDPTAKIACIKAALEIVD